MEVVARIRKDIHTSLCFNEPRQPYQRLRLVGRDHKVAVGVVGTDVGMVVREPFGQIE